jgi:signal transduction histidine kinase
VFVFSFGVVVILLILSSRNLGYLSARFLYGMILGWVTSLVALLVYLGNYNYYFPAVRHIFNINTSLWNVLVKSGLRIDVTIRLLNGGNLLFLYSLALFSCAFVFSGKNRLNARAIALLAVLPAGQMILYEPLIVRMIFSPHFGAMNEKLTVLAITKYYNAFGAFFRVANYCCIGASYALLADFAFRRAGPKYIRTYAICVFLALVPVGVIYALMFSWYPRLLMSPTMLKDFFNYRVIDLNRDIVFFDFFPFLVFGAFSGLLIVVFRYNAIETYFRTQEGYISRSINTAALGIQAFTHAVKNHLVGIKSETEYLQTLVGSDADAAYSAGLIGASCSQALDHLQVASGKLKTINLQLHPHPVSLAIQEGLKASKAHQAGFRVDCIYPEKAPLAFLDLGYMGEVFQNIFDNSWDALADRSDPRISVTVETAGRWIAVDVSDNGAGIPEDILPYVFEPFHSTKGSVNNWGIGLSFCHQIVTAHDGRISVESESGVGTQVRITLPLV